MVDFFGVSLVSSFFPSVFVWSVKISADVINALHIRSKSETMPMSTREIKRK